MRTQRSMRTTSITSMATKNTSSSPARFRKRKQIVSLEKAGGDDAILSDSALNIFFTKAPNLWEARLETDDIHFNAHFAAGLIKLDQFLNGTNRRIIPCHTKKPGVVDKDDRLDRFG